jgi:threonine dehydrogenase-like Zn-dependent dehydrogenase
VSRWDVTDRKSTEEALPVRAAIFNEPRNVTAGDRPDAAIREPSDAVVRVVLACVCASDLWYYRGDSTFEPGPIGHARDRAGA